MANIRIIYAFGLVLCGAAVAVAAGAQGAPELCLLDITMLDTDGEAAVNSTSPDAVTFLANYTVDKLNFERATVSFTAVVDPGWVATVSPASITITNQRSGTITMVVVVPAATLPSEIGTATLTGRMTTGGLQCEDVVSPITIYPLPYFDWIGSLVTPSQVNVKSGVGSFTLTIAAASSVPVSAVITLQGPEGMTFTAPATVQPPLAPTGAKNVTVSVEVRAPSLTAGAYQLTVLVTGTAPGGLTLQGGTQAAVNVAGAPSNALAMPWAPLALGGAAAAGTLVFWRRRG